MNQQEQEMLNELILESREHLSSIEPDLLDMEQNPKNVSDDLINRVFRAIHSIKGGFSFFGIQNVISLSHAMENVLSRIRDKELEITPDVNDALLPGIDKLRLLLDDVGNADSTPIDEETEKLLPYVSGDAVKQVNSASDNKNSQKSSDGTAVLDEEITKRHVTFTEENIKDSIREGKRIYELQVDTSTDLKDLDGNLAKLFEKWETLGDIYSIVPDYSEINGLEGSSQKNYTIYAIYATVLEADLISSGTDIPEERITSIDISKFKEELKENTKKEETAKQNEKTSQKETTTKSEVVVEESLRVKVSLLNNLMNLAGELVLGRNQLIQNIGRRFSETPEFDKIKKGFSDAIYQILTSASQSNTPLNPESEVEKIEKLITDLLNFRLIDLPGINGIVQNMDMVTSVIQENIMLTRMQPVSVVFSKFPRVIRDLSKKLEKEIDLEMIGQDVELDKSIIELLTDPLTHLIRNSVDHGIEAPDVREATGKNRRGKVILKAYHEGGEVNIKIIDDGAGIDPAKVRQKAIEKNLITEEEALKMSEREQQNLILLPGFSTADKISDVSGRGVGMDVVKTNVERLGGTIDIESKKGEGSVITLKLPLTLAIIPSLIISSENRRFAVPQVGLVEIVRIRAQDVTTKIENVHGAEVLRLRGNLLPLVRLSEILGLSSTFVREDGERVIDQRKRWSDRRGVKKSENSEIEIKEDRRGKKGRGKDRRANVANAVKVIVLKLEKNLFGMVVDDVQDSEEIVVKPLSEYIKMTEIYSGATIMGDGRVAMILDTAGIANKANLNFSDIEKDIEEEKRLAELEENKDVQDLILFNNGAEEHLAMPLSSIARIEKRNVDEVEIVGDKELIKYDKSTLRLLRLHNYMPIGAPRDDSDHFFVIVPNDTEHPVGIIAHHVDDIVQTPMELDTENITGAGIKGSTLIDRKLVIVVDHVDLINSVL